MNVYERGQAGIIYMQIKELEQCTLPNHFLIAKLHMIQQHQNIEQNVALDCLGRAGQESDWS